MKVNIKNVFLFVIMALAFSISSCKKFVEVDAPTTQLISSTIFTSDVTAAAAVSGMYSKMTDAASIGFMTGKLTLYPGLSSDELTNFSTDADKVQFYGNALTASNGTVGTLWSEAYQHIYRANAIIEGLENSTSVSAGLKKQLTAEAKFVRAFCHFYLVNLYGDVPYITGTDYRSNTKTTRTPKADVYEKIKTDLLDAQASLSINYSYSNNERVRPNSFAATALLARVYLYNKDWANADAQETTVISNASLYSLVSNLNNVFLKNSTEAIWQLMPVVSGFNTSEGSSFLPNPPTAVASSGANLSASLINAFETGDNRKTSWTASQTISNVSYVYPYKYKVRTGTAVTEYYMMLRLAEQYLIRAEARAQQNNLAGAIADLNVIRSRAGLPLLSTTLSQSEVIAAVKQERRVELFCEWGHRWLDLKRWNDADSVLSPVKPGWSSTDVLYPIPLQQLLNDPNMTQNSGY